jgi:Uma2 family endonuclease
MGEAARKLKCTWDDYRGWDDAHRWEVIDGVAFAMTPAPAPRHQSVVGRMHARMERILSRGRCRAFVSPIDVKLSEEDAVQPDIVVVCRPSMIKSSHIEGPPDLVVEVLSPSTELHDRKRKMPLYGRSGVKEVWLVTPQPSLVEIFVLERDGYCLRAVYGREDTLQSVSIRKLRFPLSEIFDFPLEPGEETRMVREGRPRYARR